MKYDAERLPTRDIGLEFDSRGIRNPMRQVPFSRSERRTLAPVHMRMSGIRSIANSYLPRCEFRQRPTTRRTGSAREGPLAVRIRHSNVRLRVESKDPRWPTVLKNSFSLAVEPAREKIDLSGRSTSGSWASVRGKRSPKNFAKVLVTEFFKCEGPRQPEAALKSHGIECQN